MKSSRPTIFSLLLVSVCIAGCFSPPTIEENGGVRLVYEIDDAESGGEIDPSDVEVAIDVIGLRLRDLGFHHNVAAVGDNRIEVSIVGIGREEIEKVKRRIIATGELELLIVANPRDDTALIELAHQSDDEVVRNEEGDEIGKWVSVEVISDDLLPLWRGDALRGLTQDGSWSPLAFRYDGDRAYLSEHTDQPRGAGEEPEEWQGNDVQLLLRLNPKKQRRITGAHVSSATTGRDGIGKPAINFYMTSQGSKLLHSVTSTNLPDQASSFFRRMAIVFDGKIISAPRLNSTISDRGIITGDFTIEEVDEMVATLNSGQLPVVLKSEPAKVKWIEPGR